MEINNVYSGDSLKLMHDIEFPIDLVITSPPYYNVRKYGEKYKMFGSPEDWENFCIKMLIVLSWLIKDDGVIWWNTIAGYRNHKKMTNIFRMILAVEEEVGLYLIEDYPWCKTSFLPKKYQNRAYPAYENNLVFSRHPELVIFYRDHVREPYAESTLERLKYPVGDLQSDLEGEFKNRKMVKPNPKGKGPANYFVEKADKTKRNHPAPMAPWLANWAIRAYSKKGDLVFDPMCGIGTTLIEAKKLGRDYLGIDLNEEYVEEAKKQLEKTEVGDE